jgi:hypothetical protein
MMVASVALLLTSFIPVDVQRQGNKPIVRLTFGFLEIYWCRLNINSGLADSVDTKNHSKTRQ